MALTMNANKNDAAPTMIATLGIRLHSDSGSCIHRLHQLLPEAFTHVVEKFVIARTRIIGIRPWPGHPLVVYVMQRTFGVDAVAQVNTMSEILGAGEHEFSHREITGVEVHRTMIRVI